MNDCLLLLVVNTNSPVHCRKSSRVGVGPPLTRPETLWHKCLPCKGVIIPMGANTPSVGSSKQVDTSPSLHHRRPWLEPAKLEGDSPSSARPGIPTRDFDTFQRMAKREVENPGKGKHTVRPPPCMVWTPL